MLLQTVQGVVHIRDAFGRVAQRVVDLLGHQLQIGPVRLCADSLGHQELAAHAIAALGMGIQEAGQSGEQLAIAPPCDTDAVHQLLDRLHGALPPRFRRRRRPVCKHSLLGKTSGTCQGVQRLLQSLEGDAEAELPRGLRLQMVRLVDDELAIVRQEAAAALEVGQQQRVIDHHQVGRLRPLPGRQEAARAAARDGAFPAPLGGEPLPDGAFLGRQMQLGPVAGARLLKPDEQLRQEAGLVHAQSLAGAEARPAAQA